MGIISKLRSNKTLLNGGLFSLFSFFNEGIAFLLLVLLANYIAPAEYGRLSLFNTIVSFMGFFVALSSQGFISISFFKRKNKFRSDFSSICAICLVVTGVFCVITLLGGKWIAQQADLITSFLWIAIFISFFKVFFDIWLNIYRVKEEIKKYGIVSCCFAILNLILSLFLVIKTPLNWQGRVYAQLGCTVSFGVLGLIYFSRQHLFTRNIYWPDIKMIALWGLPLIPHLTSFRIKQGGDRFIINHFHSIEDVGLFSFALNLTSIIIMVGNAFNNSNSVTIYQILSAHDTAENKRKALRKQTRNIAIITIVVTALIVVGVCALVPLLLPKYTASLPYFIILSFQGLGQCFYYLYCNYLFYYCKNKQIMFVTFFTSLLHLGLSLILTRYSLFYTCILYVVTQIIVTGLIYKLSKRILSHNIQQPEILE